METQQPACMQAGHHGYKEGGMAPCQDAIWLKSNNMLECLFWYESLLLCSPVPSGPSGRAGQQNIAGKNKGLLIMR